MHHAREIRKMEDPIVGCGGFATPTIAHLLHTASLHLSYERVNDRSKLWCPISKQTTTRGSNICKAFLQFSVVKCRSREEGLFNADRAKHVDSDGTA